MPLNGSGRIAMLRPVRWDEFYDTIGHSLVGLVRSLLATRRGRAEIARGAHTFHNDHDRYQSKGVLVFEWRNDTDATVVALNVGDNTQHVPFSFPRSGVYREQLHGWEWNVPDGEVLLEVPSNYGRIWSTA